MANNENFQITVRRSMELGLGVGLYLLIKFAATVYANLHPSFSLFAFILILGIPVVIYRCTKYYALSVPSETLSYSQLWLFGVLIFFFGSLISALGSFIYYSYIAPEFLGQQLTILSDQLKTLEGTTLSPLVNEMKTIMTDMATPTPIQSAIQTVWSSIAWGPLISLVTAKLALYQSKKNNRFIN